jgi:hypothetical protein
MRWGKGITMIDKRPRKTIEFGEHDEEFIKQFAKDIGCHYSKAKESSHNLRLNRTLSKIFI